jgi:hypothetical protein
LRFKKPARIKLQICLTLFAEYFYNFRRVYPEIRREVCGEKFV